MTEVGADDGRDRRRRGSCDGAHPARLRAGGDMTKPNRKPDKCRERKRARDVRNNSPSSDADVLDDATKAELRAMLSHPDSLYLTNVTSQ